MTGVQTCALPISSEFFEVNVLNGFIHRLRKVKRGFKKSKAWHQGEKSWAIVHAGDPETWWLEKTPVVNAKKTVLRSIPPIKPRICDESTSFFTSNDEGKINNALLLTQSAACMQDIPDSSIDYIFTDPPYGDSIQYLELSSFFLAWIYPRSFKRLIIDIAKNEILINRKRNVTIDDFKNSMEKAFTECYRTLKDEKCMTICFHNTDMQVRNALFAASRSAGFSFLSIVYQPPPRPSEKSLLHKFGSPTGDYMITFQKSKQHSIGLREIDNVDARLNDALHEIFTSRGDPVPFTLLMSLVDLAIVGAGFLPPDTNRSLKKFLEESKHYTWFKDRGWYFNDVKENNEKDTILDQVKKAIDNLKDHDKETIINHLFATFKGVEAPDFAIVKKLIKEITSRKN